MQICKQNQAANAEARRRAKNQYRPSSAMQGVFGEKKIEEEYSLYNHPVDDDVDEGYLESIIEDADAEDEEDKEFRDNVKVIESNIPEKKKKLEETQRYISEITTKINQNNVPEISTEDKVGIIKVDKVKNEEIKEENQEEINSEDEEDLAQYLENHDDEEDEQTDEKYKEFEENITIVKLRDKIKLLKHRWEASLGYTLFWKDIQNN